MSRAVRRRRPAALLVLAITLGAAVASVVTSSPAAIVGTRPPVTGAVTVDRRAATRPVVAVPAPPPAAAVAGTADPSAFYVLYATSAQGAGPARVVRLSRPGPVTATGGTLPAGADLVRAGDSLWVAGGVARAVYRLDPARLILRQRVDLPVPAQAIAATPAALWVGGPGRLVRVDLRTGTVTATVPVDGDVTSLAADPAGHRLYAAAGAAGGTTVSERDAGAGTLLASRPLAPGAGHVAATAAGVWVWQEQAGPPAMIRLRPSDLRTVAAVAAMSGPGPLHGGVAGPALWIADPTSLSCADPLTGRVRATWAAPTPQRVLAADPVRVALLAAGRVLVFPADPRCG